MSSITHFYIKSSVGFQMQPKAIFGESLLIWSCRTCKYICTYLTTKNELPLINVPQIERRNSGILNNIWILIEKITQADHKVKHYELNNLILAKYTKCLTCVDLLESFTCKEFLDRLTCPNSDTFWLPRWVRRRAQGIFCCICPSQ